MDHASPLRSTWIGLGAVILVLVGLAAIAAVMAPKPGGGFDGDHPLSTVLTGGDFAVLIAGILGALAGAREYGSA